MRHVGALPRPLQEVVDVLYRRRMVIAIVLGLGLLGGGILVKKLKPLYVAQSIVLMVAEPPGQTDRTITESPTKPILSVDLPLLATIPSVLQNVARDENLPTDETSLDKLKHHITAKLSANSSLLNLTYAAPTVTEAVSGANALADEVARFYRETAAGRFSQLVSDLRGEIRSRRAEMERLDRAIATIEETDPLIIQKADKGSAVSDQYSKLLGDLNDVRAKMRADAANASVNDDTLGAALPYASQDVADNDSIYRAARDRYAQDYSKLSGLREVYHGHFLGERELVETVKHEKTNLAAQEARVHAITPARSSTYLQFLNDHNRNHATVEADLADEREIESELAEMRGRFGVITKRQVRLQALTRDREASESAYNVLVERLATALANRAEARSVGSVTILDRPKFARSESGRSPKLIFVLVVVFSTVVAGGLVFAMECFDTRLYRSAAIEKLYGMPIIGRIAT